MKPIQEIYDKLNMYYYIHNIHLTGIKNMVKVVYN